MATIEGNPPSLGPLRYPPLRVAVAVLLATTLSLVVQNNLLLESVSL